MTLFAAIKYPLAARATTKVLFSFMTVGTISGTSGHRLVNILKGECYLTEPGLKAYTTTMDKLFEKKNNVLLH